MSHMPDWRETVLPGVLMLSLAPHADGRGSLTEVWRESWTAGLIDGGVRQANLSRSHAGVLRGMHLHLGQTDVWVLLDGRATVALADLRRMRAGGSDPPAAVVLDVRPGTALLIPPRIAHGLYAVQDLALLYLVSAEYNGEDESGFRWDDPAAAIPWPAFDPIVSVRDSTAQSLGSLLESLPPPG